MENPEFIDQSLKQSHFSFNESEREQRRKRGMTEAEIDKEEQEIRGRQTDNNIAA